MVAYSKSTVNNTLKSSFTQKNHQKQMEASQSGYYQYQSKFGCQRKIIIM